MPELPDPYTVRDLAPFAPSGAVYFMRGTSDATVKLRGSEQEIRLEFEDENTSIAASAPVPYDAAGLENGLHVPVPPPLRAVAFYPHDTPTDYRRPTTLHLLQVVSMNMRAKDGSSRLLIGLPYAEAYPEVFFSAPGFAGEPPDGSSYGVVQSLTEFDDSPNGYPARSFFGIYHIIETPVGTFFNKKPTQMELQPNDEGKLALTLPPIPFVYSLLNGPIPLYDVNAPDRDPVGDIVAAHHEGKSEATQPTEDAWPWHQPDLEGIMERRRDSGQAS